MEEQDWAALSREYRRRRGLKQESGAYDFNVDQSTISRWERGEREPSLAAKHMILNTLLDAGLAQPDQSMQFLLEQSGSTVAVWDRNAVLRGYSKRFAREIGYAVGLDDLRHRPAREILGSDDIVERAISILTTAGFFDGKVALAVFTFPPFLQERRQNAGGMVTSSTFPIRLGGGEIAMLSILDHDTFHQSGDDHRSCVTWMSATDGHSRSEFLDDAW